MELIDIKGIGPKRLTELSENNIKTPLDLLNHYPIKYLDYTAFDEYDSTEGATLTMNAEVTSEPKCVFFHHKSYVIAEFCDKTSEKKFKAVWYNQSFMKNNLNVGESYYLIGKINKKKQLVVTNYLKSENGSTLVPIYSGDVGSAFLRNVVSELLKTNENFSCLPNIEGEMTLNEAYSEIHFPTDIEKLEKAKDRVGLENLAQLASLEQKLKALGGEKNRKYNIESLDEFKKVCPFQLTQDQENALKEIMDDLASKKCMNRLVMGDVGSGKTMVALGASFVVNQSGYQSVLICPTEILAKQHYETAKKIFSESLIKVGLLTSSCTTVEKNDCLKKIKLGEIDLVVATHAIFSEKCEFKNLALVITDEQHRFGVKQRAMLKEKETTIDQLIMSATPIPRSLALVMFGGLDITTINARPNGESKIATKIVPKSKEQDMWKYILEQLETSNSKVFVVVPRIGAIEESNVESVDTVLERLVEFGVKREAIVVSHGKMTKPELDEAIEKFRSGECKILISTTIIEVGIDIKEANIMVVYSAERFGLATLHQLRGRIGRDGRDGYCFCLQSVKDVPTTERLKIFRSTNSGFILAEEDLKLRGAGTIYGTKQHGAKELFLNINYSLKLYNKAKEIVSSLKEEDLVSLQTLAEERFGDIYSKIVLN